jgi:DNA modification methylase
VSYETYERGPVKLVLADCLEWLPTLEAGSVDAVVTSPPYNQLESLPENGSGLWGKTAGGAGFLRAWKERGYADEIREPEYQRQQNDLFGMIAEVSSDTASLFYNHQIRWRDGECIHPVDWFKPAGWKMRQEIIWDRGGGMMFNARMFCRFDERVLWFVRGDTWVWNQESVGHGTIWRIAREQQQQGKFHPVAFPVEVPTRCILAATNIGGLVLEPYAGSATTAIACIRTGRRFIGCEIERKYFDIACARIDRELDQGRLFDAPEPKEVQRELIPS